MTQEKHQLEPMSMADRNRVNDASDAVRDIAALARPVTASSVMREIGRERYEGLSARQQWDLARKLRVLRLWQSFVKLVNVRQGNVGTWLAVFIVAAGELLGKRLGMRTFLTWRRRYAAGGLTALIDTRGRPPGPAPLDGELVTHLIKLLGRGISLPEAHQIVGERARNEARRWCCLRTLQDRMRGGRTAIAWRKQNDNDDPHEYLCKGAGGN